MNAGFDQASLDMGARQTVRLYDAAGASIRVVAGAVWVTQDRDARDVVLQPGEQFTLDRPGLSVLEALEPSRVVVEPSTAAQAGASPRRSAAGSPAIRSPRRWYVGTSNPA
jgi:hypothetical protein